MKANNGVGNKFWIIGLAVLAVGFVALVIAVIVLQRRNVPAVVVKPTSQNLVQSKVVLDWLGTQKDSRGIYWANYDCTETPSFTCGRKDPSNYTGIPVMWGMSKYYLATKDESVLNLIRNDIKTYADDTKVQIIGTYNLTCRLIADMLSEPIWSASEKQSLQKICLKTDLISDRLSRNLSGNKDITTDSLIPKVNDKLLYLLSPKRPENKVFSDYTQIISDEQMDFYPYISTELLEMYKISLNKDYLKRALYITDISLENLINNKKIGPDVQCRIGRNLLSFNNFDFSNTADFPNFLNLSRIIFESNKNTSAIDCAFLGSELYNTTKENRYKDYLKKRLVNMGGYSFLDTPEVKAFVFKRLNDSTTIELDKNALLVGLLSINETL